MLCSVKGSVHDLSEIFIPKVEGKFHATKSKVIGIKHNSFKTLKTKSFSRKLSDLGLV